MIDDPRDRRAGPCCPTCNRPVSWSACTLIALGGWLHEANRVPLVPLPLELEPAPAPAVTSAGG